MLLENAHMKRRAARKSGRGGRALLTGLVRCGRCGRMMRVFYGMQSGHAHRYQCRGDDAHVGFIVNRPTQVSLGELFAGHGHAQKLVDPVYSGGPLADTTGRVVGINTMIAGGLALAIPINDVRRFVAARAASVT